MKIHLFIGNDIFCLFYGWRIEFIHESFCCCGQPEIAFFIYAHLTEEFELKK